MSTTAPLPVPALSLPATLPRWRSVGVVVGVSLGLLGGFISLYFSTLPFFLVPIAQEFGWGRGDVSGAAALAMLGMTLGAPFVGRALDRYGARRVLASSVLVFAALLAALSVLPASLALFSTLAFAIGVGASACGAVGWQAVLPRWFDRRLGLALGLSGIGGGIGVALLPSVVAPAIASVGWRSTYLGLALFALAAGMLALVLAAPRAEAGAARRVGQDSSALPGLTLAQAARDWRFWLLIGVTFVATFGVLGAAVHGASLAADNGLTPRQAAAAAGLAGAGALLARIGVGALLDRWHAPAVAAVMFAVGGAGLAVNSGGGSFAWLAFGMFLGGCTMGAEGDLIPYLVRRYFGLKAFGAIFGAAMAAYALGGVAGPLVYGLSFDRQQNYSLVMMGAAAGCWIAAVGVLALGRYRYGRAS